MRLTDHYGAMRLEDLEPTGLPELQDALAAFTGSAPQHISITCGGMMALTCVFKALRLRTESASLLAPCPHFPAYPGLAQLEGFAPDFYILDPKQGWQPDIVALERQIAAIRPGIVLLNSPHNPTGSVLSAGTMGRIHAAAEKVGAWLVLDEAFSGLALDFEEPSLPSGPKVVRVGSLNKRFPSLVDVRVGYVIAEPDLLRDVSLLHRTLVVGASLRDQRLATTVLRSRPQKVLARVRAELLQQRDEACAILNSSGVLRCHIPSAGLFLWVRLPDGWDPLVFRDALKSAHGFWAASGPRFGWERWPVVRFRFGIPRRLMLQQAEALSEFAKTWEKNRHLDPTAHDNGS